MASIGKIEVELSADTRRMTQSLQRVNRWMSGEPTVMDLVRDDPSVILFWVACVLLPIVLVLAR